MTFCQQRADSETLQPPVAELRLPWEAGAEAGTEAGAPRHPAGPSNQLALVQRLLQSIVLLRPPLGFPDTDSRYTSLLGFQNMDSHNYCNYFQSYWLNFSHEQELPELFLIVLVSSR